MGSRFLTDMADVLRAAGLDVTEQDGWKTRARRSGGYEPGRPYCIMWHHAASAPNTTTENVAYYASFGSSVAPVCNLVVGRAGDVTVCAAGATNTDGAGGRVDATHPALVFSRGTVPEDQMNSHAIGIEAVNTGVGQEWPQAQIDAYFKINNALAAAYGLQPSDCCLHSVWSPGRKIDPATAEAVQGPWQPRDTTSAGSWALSDVRAEAAHRATPTPPTPIPGDDEMELYLWQDPRYANVFLLTTGTAFTVDGDVYAVKSKQLPGVQQAAAHADAVQSDAPRRVEGCRHGPQHRPVTGHVPSGSRLTWPPAVLDVRNAGPPPGCRDRRCCASKPSSSR